MDKPRPIKFSLSSSVTVDRVNQVLRNAKKPRLAEGYKGVYIYPDRTVEECRSFKKLLDVLKLKRISEPNITHMIRNNKVVSSATGVFHTP
jgi:hypothetical protein